MKQTVLTGLLLAAAVGLIVVTCSLGPKLPVEVSSAIEAAGDNGAELEKVITHYRTAGDTLKLEAALFLIGNM
ncbi:MAG: transglutaminase domain-containing protein, partial [candidate division Zixibacteria bacterium]|nr:transglutaminase domain-containing protein [candidate division Zixibacteria bacterium]